MRLLLHTVFTLTIAAILGCVAVTYLGSRQTAADRALARAELSRFQQQIHLQAALLDREEIADRSGPVTVDPAWFKEEIPLNPLLGAEHPWVEIAGPPHRRRLHPPNLTATDPGIAAFWYNPTLSIVRARVPAGISDAQALALYNEINDSDLGSLFPTE